MTGIGLKLAKELELDLGDALALCWYSGYLFITKGSADAVVAAQKAVQLDPFSPMVNLMLAGVYYWDREYDLAEITCKKGIELDSAFFGPYSFLGTIYSKQHFFDKAEAMFHKAYELSESPYTLAQLASFYGFGKKKEQALTLLNQLTEKAKLIYVAPTSLAMIHFSLKDIDKTFEYFELAYEERDQWLPVFLKLESTFDSIRSDSRFQNLLSRLRL
jgi:tetratricopeptide (TPR) repeat protein